MADPICRWRNPYVKTIVELVQILPKQIMPSEQFRTIVEKRWPGFLRTAYQLACQTGLYYESDDGVYYPRFDHDIEENEANVYMQNWIRKYYVPNPYTKSMKSLQQPQPFLASIIGYIYEHPDEKELHSILESVFQEDIGNIDIISNVLNTYTDLMKVDNQGNIELNVKARDFMKQFIDRNDKKAFFDIFSEENKNTEKVIANNKLSSFIFSVISYLDKEEGLEPIAAYAQDVERGNPIKVSATNQFSLVGMFIETSLEDIRNRNISHIRWFEKEFKLGERNVYLSTQWTATDDYQLTLSDFLKLIRLCYGKKYSYNLNNGVHELYVVRGKGKIGPLQQIFYGAPGTGKSHKVKELIGKENVIRTTFHPDSDYSTFVGCYKPTTVDEPLMTVIGTKAVAVENGDGTHRTESRIVYEFVEQAFLKAYIKAWKMYAENENNPQKQYLIIEEINRGNCAQIFGDLFQLLDRGDNGFSEYPIDADKDMQKHLAKAFKDMAYLDAPAIGEMSAEETARAIRCGEKLILPNNLYIWATMNTSDQSLFPIDSAFKRRWDWEYVPIHNCNKGWRIVAGNNEYDWWSFLEQINNIINKLTSSEDKKLGYFFCKADEKGVISAEKFVAKVLFYLWNDVFKDYEVDTNILKDGESSLNFNSFYGVNGKETFIRKDKVDLFLSNLGVKLVKNDSIVDDEQEEDEDNNDDSGSKVRLTITFPDGEVIAGNTKFESYRGALEKIGLQHSLQIAEEKLYQRHNCSLIDTTQRDEILNDPVYSYVKVGDYYLVKGINGITMRNMLSLISNRLNLNLIINYQ